MPSIFISYASEQEAFAQQLEKELTAKDIEVWRDKTNLHAGQRWPKALGEAIACADALLLLWSVEASQSDFVELEWNTAVAIQKPVMPCLLDDTSLPPTLKPSHRIPADNTQQATEQIMTALKDLLPSVPSKQQEKLLETLNTVSATEPQQVLQHLNTIINQPNWSVGGNVYQAQGDLYIGATKTVPTKKPEPAKLDTYIKWVGLGVASLTFIGLLLDLPTKFMDLIKDQDLSQSNGLKPSQSETSKKLQPNTKPVENVGTQQGEAKSEDTRPHLHPRAIASKP